MNQNRSGARKSTRRGLRWDGEGLWDWNLESNRIHFSPRWISLIGHQDHELSNTPDEWFQRVHPDDSALLLRDIEVARTEGSEFEFRYRLRHKDGTHRWMASRGVVVRNDGGEAIRLTGSQSDVTVETVTDPITRLPNRLLLLDRLAQSIDRALRYKAFHFAVLLIDLGRPAGDGQKSRGSGGDALLTAAARRLETSLRIPETTPSLRNNDLVARLDGDQFAILLNGLKDVSHAKVVGDRILRELLSPFAFNGRESRLSPSIGIAVSATGYTQPNDVLHDAETALHRAQMLGGSDCELFDTAILKSEQAELQLEGEFEASLERREFELLYQPIVSLTSNQVVGFEALVRWKHPALGLIVPLDFIPIAEATGFIVPLGHWILREACQRLRIWQTRLPHAKDVWISVNLSSVQLGQEELAEHVAEILAESGLDPGTLVLELTEGVAMENPMAVKSLLMRLRAMGVRISIDDFGTGYSSLAYLHQFPVDALKVDRSFVRGMVADKDTAEIVASIIAMARQLGLHIVAEGVENEDQLAALRALQCSAAQGHLFAKPLDANDAAALLSTGMAARSGRATSANPRDGKRAPAEPLIASLFGSRRRLLIAASLPVLVASATLLSGFYRVPAATSISTSDSATPPQQQENAITQAESAEPVSETKLPDSSGAKPPDNAPMKPAAATKSTEMPKPVSAAPMVPSGTAATKPDTSVATTPLSPIVPPPPVKRVDPPSAAGASPVEEPAPKVSRRLLPTASSFDVQHLHRIGSCRGRLMVAPDGISFVPEKDGDDGVALPYAEFVHALAKDTLTLKTATKTYRFRAADAKGGEDQTRQLRELAEKIGRFSRPVTATRTVAHGRRRKSSLCRLSYACPE